MSHGDSVMNNSKLEVRKIVLTGFMGTGKTEVGKMLAEELGWDFLDMDEEIESRESRSIAAIFEESGEAYFRSLESELCREIISLDRTVVAAGGGTVISPENRSLLLSSGLIVNLKATPKTILSRVSGSAARPLLNVDDPEQRIHELLIQRAPAYDALPFHVDTSNKTIPEITEDVMSVAAEFGTAKMLSVSSGNNSGYSVIHGPKSHNLLGAILQSRGFSPKIAVVTDSNVENLYLNSVVASLCQAGFDPFAYVIPAGEQSKNLVELAKLYSAFVRNGLDRRGAVISLGGGVVGDLAGFAAATYMRGVALVQCPTTLLSMVDASIGGKTGVDLLQGKNLVGAFKQPLAVVTQTSAIKTLPESEIRNGMAEVIKHCIIDDKELFETFELNSPLSPNSEMVRRSAAVKIRVVQSDPLETGYREVLNLGHTVGHALEKVSDYSISHGDAVAVGLIAAAKISSELQLCDNKIVDRLHGVLIKYDLPVTHTGSVSQIMESMKSDKKSVAGQFRFVLIKNIGDVVHGIQVEAELIENILAEMKDSRK